ncbi:MAG TPA: autorepressor SdpR family transcription factor, partial [Fimbriimonadaceae bacterium]|nr:autorepressor SdpR family transcription factor [Fimbriimonadaceae bacterium]
MNDVVFRAIADPTRRRILRLLGSGEMTAGELAKHFDITAPSMSHHFSVLRNAGLVTSRKEGQQVCYVLNTTVIQDFLAVLLDLF